MKEILPRDPESSGTRLREETEKAEADLKQAEFEKELYRSYYVGQDPERFAGIASKLGTTGSKIFSELFLTYGAGLDVTLAKLKAARNKLERLKGIAQSEARHLNEHHQELIKRVELAIRDLETFERNDLGMKKTKTANDE